MGEGIQHTVPVSLEANRRVTRYAGALGSVPLTTAKLIYTVVRFQIDSRFGRSIYKDCRKCREKIVKRLMLSSSGFEC